MCKGASSHQLSASRQHGLNKNTNIVLTSAGCLHIHYDDDVIFPAKIGFHISLMGCKTNAPYINSIHPVSVVVL